MDCTLSAYDTLVDWLTDRVAGYLTTRPRRSRPTRRSATTASTRSSRSTCAPTWKHEFGILVEPTLAWDYPTIERHRRASRRSTGRAAS